MNMIDGNTAALREYLSEQDRLESQAPTDRELDSFVEDWIERKLKKDGSSLLVEAFVESSDFEGVYRAFMEHDDTEIGFQFRKLVEAYLRPLAEEASNDHNFAEDRVPCKCRGDCVC